MAGGLGVPGLAEALLAAGNVTDAALAACAAAAAEMVFESDEQGD